VFAVPGVDGWQADDTSRYVLTVSDARAAAPAVTRALVTAGADPVTTLIICQSHGNRITEPVTAWFEHAPAATWVIPPK